MQREEELGSEMDAYPPQKSKRLQMGKTSNGWKSIIKPMRRIEAIPFGEGSRFRGRLLHRNHDEEGHRGYRRCGSGVIR